MVDISIVSRYWAEFDLEGRRPALDEVGLKIAEHQEEAMQNRKKLAEATKEFKKTHAEDPNAKAFGALLRLYQEEIDRLTKRAKHGEGAFLTLYEKLSEAPDPSPALNQAFETASKATDLEAQLRKVSQELAEYKAESTQIKNQDLTIRKLEEKVRALEAHADEKDRKIQEAQQKAAAEADAARMAQMQERERELSAMLMQAHSSLAAMQKLHQASQNQLFALQSASEEENVGRQSELELASSELERAQERLTALTREKQQLIQQLVSQKEASSKAESHAPSSATVEEGLQSELGLQREVRAGCAMELRYLLEATA
jgi:homeobox protein cut-like